jgi:hypothetical protein
MVIVWSVALLGFYHIGYRHVEVPTRDPTAIIAYSAAMIALAGWMYQSWLAVRNSRKQHTMNVLLQTRLNPLFAEHAEIIEAAFPLGKPITFDALALTGNAKAKDSVRWILNYYEFIAAGIHHGDLDEALMQDCMLTQLCRFFKKSEDYIRQSRGEDAAGKPDPRSARVMKSLIALQPRWQRKLDRSLPPVWER